jgi:hypothetical protein
MSKRRDINVVYPRHMTLSQWAGKLVGDYSDNFLPVLVDEAQWQPWGAILASCEPFRGAKIPNPHTMNPNGATNSFNNWEEWAKAVSVCMNNYQE